MKDQYDMPRKLENPIQHYPWGSKTLIPELLGIPNPQDAPFAELWMGVHPRGPSKLVCPSGEFMELSALISQRSVAVLGPDAAVRFDNRLPFLFKVLAAEQPLSIQAHPNRKQAEEGFKEEELRGIPIDAFERNYRDRNHKPEIICALTHFTAMCGFRRPEEIEAFYREMEEETGCRVYRESLRPGDPAAPEALEAPAALAALEAAAVQAEGVAALEDPWLRNFFQNLLTLGTEKKAVLDEAVHTWALTRKGRLAEADLVLKFHVFHPGDPGVQAPLFLNVVELEPGQALYQPAGVLHAYVEGMGIELMANSDNVLRGGLTGKHVDVPELLKVLSFRPRGADVLEGIPLSGGGRRYDLPIDEFRLFLFALPGQGESERGTRTSVDIGICTEGEIFLKKYPQTNEHVLHVVKGESFFVPYAFGEYVIEGRGMVALATVPAGGTVTGAGQVPEGADVAGDTAPEGFGQ